MPKNLLKNEDVFLFRKKLLLVLFFNHLGFNLKYPYLFPLFGIWKFKVILHKLLISNLKKNFQIHSTLTYHLRLQKLLHLGIGDLFGRNSNDTQSADHYWQLATRFSEKQTLSSKPALCQRSLRQASSECEWDSTL